ncbi:MAG: rod shape-determining protein [Clostridia bacterium]|nr:rod shape-determining protein [Clostridia bacterium]MBQ5771040.1 rod shape-determining protein [Clostridia bacterium]
MSVFSMGAIGVDLGSENTVVALQDEGVVLREPTAILASAENESEIIALGKDAKRMMGRTDRETVLLEPISYGAVAHSEFAAMCLLGMSEKACQRRRPFEKNRLCVTHPYSLTHVEKHALSSAVMLAGAKRALLVPSAVAAAVGKDIHIERPTGNLVISIGSEVTEISLISMMGVVASRTMKTGSRAFDEAIIRYIRREKGLVIGAQTAENLKKDIGSIMPEEKKADTLTLRGRNILTGKPSTETITSFDVAKALDEPVRALVESLSDALYNVPAELSGDLLDTGIHLTGAGCLLHGLPERIRKETQLKVFVGENPENDAALGACRIAADEKMIRALMNAGSAIEV